MNDITTKQVSAEIKRLVERNEYLEEKVAYLERELGHAISMKTRNVLERAFKLTNREADLLLLLYQQKEDRPINQERLFLAMYEHESDVELKIIDVFVCKLRKKIGDHNPIGKRSDVPPEKKYELTGFHKSWPLIETGWGRGYRLTEAGRAKVKAALDPATE